jgi:hypothetical protein
VAGDPTIAAASSLQIVIIGMLILLVRRIFAHASSCEHFARFFGQ